MSGQPAPWRAPADPDADLERRFGGLRRLWGAAPYQRVRQACAVVVGVGGVGSWAAEALARHGVATLVLVDLDHVAESNINRQVQALGSTVGQAKVQALAQRLLDIHPGCAVHPVEAFVEAARPGAVADGSGNWPGLLPAGLASPPQVVLDCCDQVSAKLTLACWALREGVPLVSVGAAGGKVSPAQVEVGDLFEVTHDPLLASLRQRLRKALAAGGEAAVPATAAARPRKATAARIVHSGVRCVFSREAVRPPVEDACEAPATGSAPQSLNCHGYGSTVTVTATFGMVAAAEAVRMLAQAPAAR